MRIELQVGQYLDLVCPASGAFDDPIITDIALFKTAEYTVERPLHLGAALTGTDAYDDSLSRFGLAVGEAFQHCDDLLGVFGCTEETGKPCGDDYELDHVVAGYCDGAPRLDPAEASEFAWLTIADLDLQMRYSSDRFTPWLQPVVDMFIGSCVLESFPPTTDPTDIPLTIGSL